MKQIVFNEKAIKFLNSEKAKALDDIAVTIVHKDTLKQKDKEIERLQKRINKAIEYIEERKKLNWYADGVFVYELLNILQGSE